MLVRRYNGIGEKSIESLAKKTGWHQAFALSNPKPLFLSFFFSLPNFPFDISIRLCGLRLRWESFTTRSQSTAIWEKASDPFCERCQFSESSYHCTNLLARTKGSEIGFAVVSTTHHIVFDGSCVLICATADAELLPLIDHANVACGFHAGDPLIMENTIKACKENGVAVGAHPGLPDIQGFGRRDMKLQPEELTSMTRYQLGALKAFLDAYGMSLHHAKPHGTFYVEALRQIRGLINNLTDTV